MSRVAVILISILLLVVYIIAATVVNLYRDCSSLEWILLCAGFLLLAYLIFYMITSSDSSPSTRLDSVSTCTKSKPAPSKSRSRSSSPGRTHKTQDICQQIFERYFGVKFMTDVRPPWLINDRTGHRLEIDICNEEIGWGCEYQGEQHYNPTHPFNKTLEDYQSQVYRDELKRKICRERGFKLVIVPYTVKKECLEEYIHEEIRRETQRSAS